MNNSMIKKSLLATALLVAAHGAMAANPTSTINVSGNITTSTCTIAASNVNQTVNLPSSLTSDLLNGATLKPVTFQFGITNCSSTYSKATATVNGTTAGSDVTGYGNNAVIANTGSATNVGIGLIGSSSVGSTPAGALPVGTASAVATLTAVGGATTTSGTLYLGAQIVPLTKAVAAGAGTVAGTATVTFTYS
ncbi:fimbrial protein [Enterobacter vonholyi]